MKKFLLPFILTLMIASCVEQSTTLVDFDIIKQSATFKNDLLAKVQLYLNGKVVDTLEAMSVKIKPINAKGSYNWAWQLIPPKDGNNSPAGISPKIDLGLQYDVLANYVIDNTSFNKKDVFTPRISNLTTADITITANISDKEGSFRAIKFVKTNSNTEIDRTKANQPYYYWLSNSTLTCEGIGINAINFTRGDTTVGRSLKLDESTNFKGSGLTEPLIVK